jgi:LysR family hydrogen peroxide-inducible transcriptional activator
LPTRLAQFTKKYPHIQVSVVEEITSVLLAHLHAGKIDLLLVALPVVGDGLVCTELHREALYVVAPAEHPLAKKQSVFLREIQNDPFILLKDGHCFRDTAVAACRRARVRPNVVFESGHFATILAMVAAGMGFSVVPEMAIEKRAGCRFLRLSDDHSYRKIGLVHLKNHFQTNSHRALVQYLKGDPATKH